MKTYRIAIIGLGGMGSNHALAVQAEDGCQLVGGTEIDSQRARAWKEGFGVDTIFDDYEKMLDQLGPDIVINTTQSPLHYAPALAAACHPHILRKADGERPGPARRNGLGLRRA